MWTCMWTCMWACIYVQPSLGIVQPPPVTIWHAWSITSSHDLEVDTPDTGVNMCGGKIYIPAWGGSFGTGILCPRYTMDWYTGMCFMSAASLGTLAMSVQYTTEIRYGSQDMKVCCLGGRLERHKWPELSEWRLSGKSLCARQIHGDLLF